MKCYTLDNKLKRHYIDIKQVINEVKGLEDNQLVKAICLYLKKNYGTGSYYLEGKEDITIIIDKNEIRYFTSLCNWL